MKVSWLRSGEGTGEQGRDLVHRLIGVQSGKRVSVHTPSDTLPGPLPSAYRSRSKGRRLPGFRGCRRCTSVPLSLLARRACLGLVRRMQQGPCPSGRRKAARPASFASALPFTWQKMKLRWLAVANGLAGIGRSALTRFVISAIYRRAEPILPCRRGTDRQQHPRPEWQVCRTCWSASNWAEAIALI